MQEILKFKINERELHLYKNDNSFVYAPSDITVEEKKIVLNVFKQIIPKAIINLGSLTLGEKEILHIMDKDIGMHLFYEQKNNSLQLLSKNYQEVLNSLFNNQHEYAASGLSKPSSGFFKRLVKFGEKTLVVLVSAALAFSLTIDFNHINSSSDNDLEISTDQAYHFIEGEEQKLETVASQENTSSTQNSIVVENNKLEDKKITVEEIERIIKNNQNLRDEEKDLFLSNPQIFIDNLDYFDKEVVVDQLENLWVGYVENSPQGYGGEYFGRTCEANRYGIIVYNATCFEDCNKANLLHEFCHSLSDLDGSHRPYGQASYEILNTQFNNEYFGIVNGQFPNQIYDEGYSWLRNGNYILDELLDQDILKKYHACPNPKILVSALTKIIPDEDLAIKLLTNIDLINAHNIDFSNNFNGEIDQELYRLAKAANDENKEIFKYYYEIKFGEKIENQPSILYWWDNTLFYEYIANNYDISSQAVRFLPNYTSVSNYKTYINILNPENNSLTIRYCTDVEEHKEYYTLEQMLNGESGDHFKSVDEIPYKQMADGTYEMVWLSSGNFANITLETVDLEQSITK